MESCRNSKDWYNPRFFLHKHIHRPSRASGFKPKHWSQGGSEHLIGYVFVQTHGNSKIRNNSRFLQRKHVYTPSQASGCNPNSCTKEAVQTKPLPSGPSSIYKSPHPLPPDHLSFLPIPSIRQPRKSMQANSIWLTVRESPCKLASGLRRLTHLCCHQQRHFALETILLLTHLMVDD